MEYSWVPLPNESKHFVFGFPLPFCDWICLVCSGLVRTTHCLFSSSSYRPYSSPSSREEGAATWLASRDRLKSQRSAIGPHSPPVCSNCANEQNARTKRKETIIGSVADVAAVAFVIVTPVISASHCNVGCNRCGGAFMVTWIMDGPGRMTKDSGTGGQTIGTAHTFNFIFDPFDLSSFWRFFGFFLIRVPARACRKNPNKTPGEEEGGCELFG